MNYMLTLNKYVNNGGNCVNLGRVLEKTEIDLYQWVIKETSFLNRKAQKITFNERVYCLLSGLETIPMGWDKKEAYFINLFEGYNRRKMKFIKQLMKQKNIIERDEDRKDNIKRKRLVMLPAPSEIPKSNHYKYKVFVYRNKKENKHLYEKTMIEGEDYVVCPISKCRMSKISNSYIKNTLGMKLSDYPEIQRVSERHRRAIQSGLRQKCENGLTKHQVAHRKAQNTLKKKDKNGVSGYDRIGMKTKKTHMEKIDEHGRNGYERIAAGAIIKGNKTKQDKGLILDASLRNEFYRYKAVVLYLTKKVNNEYRLTEGYDIGLAGKEGAYQLDHIFSIYDGYKSQVSPFVVSHQKNLRVIPWKENIAKWNKSEFSMKDLHELVGISIQKSKTQFNSIVGLINIHIEKGYPVSGVKIINDYCGIK